MRKLGPVRSHEVLRLHGAQRNDVFIGAAIAHHANRFDREKDGERLAGLVVPVGGTQFIDEDRVGPAQQVGKLFLHFTEDAYPQARPREGVAIDHLVRQAEGDAQFADFILEQFTQGLKKLEVQGFGQAANVMVALDGVRLAGLAAGRFDHVGVDRALRQPFGVGALLGFGLEDFDELAADDLALLLGVGNALQVPHELLGGVDVDDAHAEVAGKGTHHLLGFVEAQQAVVDEDAGQLVTDGAMQQRGNDRGIDPA